MAFAAPQLRKLRARLNPRHVKCRDAEGQTLHYVEGWHVVSEANRIFGFDGWDRETVSSECVWTKQMGQRFCAAYVARVRITVRAGDTRVTREGCGVGDSNAASPGQAHDFAAKAAKTDATKRALMTFGNAFGLSLYGAAAGAEGAPRRAAPPPLWAEPPRQADKALAPGPAILAPDAPDGLAARPDVLPMVAESRVPPVVNGVSADNGLQNGHLGDQNPLPFRPIDKSLLALAEPRRMRDTAHLRFVAGQPCLVCDRTPTEAHHLRFAQARAMGRKVSDEYTVPLCALHHRDLHARGNEPAWWQERKLAPLEAAAALWQESRGHKAVSTSWPQRDPAPA